MRRAFRAWAFLLTFLGTIASAHPLVWDAMEKTREVTTGEGQITVTFTLRNTSDEPVEIKNIVTSCHCTVVRSHPHPWIVAPGGEDQIEATIDLRSRRGGLTKTIYVGTSAGEQQLQVHVNIPPPPAAQRERNLQLAQTDRQAVLKGDCASCHVAPAQGKTGQALYLAACAICHTDDTHRASMVPDLNRPQGSRDAEYWRKWIGEGGPGTLMPAFAEEHGGFLDRDEIDALVEHLLVTLPTEPASN